MHVTAVGVPSDPRTPDAEQEESQTSGQSTSGGFWRKEWTMAVQGNWLEAFYGIAFSKRVVESVAWLDLADNGDGEMPAAGLLRDNLQPKKAFQRLSAMRKRFHDQENGAGGAR